MIQKYDMENKFLKKYNLFIYSFKKNWFDKFSILNLLPYELFLKEDYFVPKFSYVALTPLNFVLFKLI